MCGKAGRLRSERCQGRDAANRRAPPQKRAARWCKHHNSAARAAQRTQHLLRLADAANQGAAHGQALCGAKAGGGWRQGEVSNRAAASTGWRLAVQGTGCQSSQVPADIQEAQHSAGCKLASVKATPVDSLKTTAKELSSKGSAGTPTITNLPALHWFGEPGLCQKDENRSRQGSGEQGMWRGEPKIPERMGEEWVGMRDGCRQAGQGSQPVRRP